MVCLRRGSYQPGRISVSYHRVIGADRRLVDRAAERPGCAPIVPTTGVRTRVVLYKLSLHFRYKPRFSRRQGSPVLAPGSTFSGRVTGKQGGHHSDRRRIRGLLSYGRDRWSSIGARQGLLHARGGIADASNAPGIRDPKLARSLRSGANSFAGSLQRPLPALF